MRRVIANIILYFLLTVILLACATGNRTIDFDPNFAIESLQTFAVEQDSGSNADPLNSQRIHDAIQNYLTKKEYAYKTNKAHSDFIALYNIMLYKNVPSNFSIGIGLGSFSIGRLGAGIGTSMTPTTDKVQVKVEMYDPKTKNVFWSASATKTPTSFDTPEARTDFFNQVISELLEKFPARTQ